MALFGNETSSEYTKVRNQLDKTEKRLKTEVDAMEAQTPLLKSTTTKIDETDEHSPGEIGLTVENEQGGSASAGFRDEQLPREIKTQPQLYKYEYSTSV